MYAQSPHSMRGMMVGLFFLVDGVFSSLSATILFGFSAYFKHTHLSCGFWYYFVFLVPGIATFILYLAVARYYRNRTRGDVNNDRYYRLQF
jgi:hypothetical protein